MKRSPRPSRSTSNLSESAHQQLNSYALAAGAAGVSLLALTLPSEAKVVYTPAHVFINGFIPLDLNHDGVTDFLIGTHTSATTGAVYAFLLIETSSGGGHNQIMGTNAHDSAFALHAGAMVGPKKPFQRLGSMAEVRYNLFSHTTEFRGRWANGGKGVSHRYLGLKFQIHGKVHFGWARLNVDVSHHSITATLTGYAYETIPNKPIIAGKTKGPEGEGSFEHPDHATLTAPTSVPASLSLLAMGSPGLSIWRRKELAEATP